jgi:hypothetical protein
MRILATGLICLVIAVSGFALPTADIHVPHYDIIYAGDLDPQGEMGRLANDITVTLHLDQPYSFILYFSLEFGNMEIATTNFVGMNCASGTLGPYSISEIRSGELAGEVCIVGAEGDFNEDFLEHLSGNMLPAGRYTLRARYEPLEGDDHGSSQVSHFTLRNPRQVDLLLPSDGSTLFESEPVFTWSGQASRYQFRLCAFDPDRHGSVEEAIEGLLMWEVETHDTSLIYGQGAGALPLQSGMEYVWQVESLISTSSGERSHFSPIFHFSRPIANPVPVQDFLSGLNASQLLALAGFLGDLQVDGPPRMDGRVLSDAEFAELLARISSGDLQLSSLRLE